ncbi:MAG: hypothetical protein ACR2OD_10145 [Gaiellaceae bacterium]
MSSSARELVERLELELEPLRQRIEAGPFVRAVADGTFPLDGIRFVHTNHYHLLLNDLANANIAVARARTEEEMLSFHAIAAEEKNQLAALFELTDALEIDRDELATSAPSSSCLLRTNYLSRLVQYGSAGEIALATLLTSRARGAASKAESQGLAAHYGLDQPATDVLHRLEVAADASSERALKSIALDVASAGGDERLSEIAHWALEYEAMVWDAYYDEGLVLEAAGAGV